MWTIADVRRGTTGDMMMETMMKLVSDNNYTYYTCQRAMAKR